jgi:hypothetical protein
MSNRSSNATSVNNSRDYKTEIRKIKSIRQLSKKILTSYASNEMFYKKYENIKSTNSSRASSNRSSKMSTPRKKQR